MPKYKVTFTAKFEGFVEASNEKEAAFEIHIPEHPELDVVPEGSETVYVENSYEILEVVDVTEPTQVVDTLRTNPGDRFVIKATDLDWRDSDGGWNLTQGLIHPEFSEDALVLMVVGERRENSEDFWDCYSVPSKEAGPMWDSQDLWKEEEDRPAAILNDDEVRAAIDGSIDILRRAFIELQEKK